VCRAGLSLAVKWWTIAVKKRIEMSPSFATAQKPGVIGDPTRATLSLKINGRPYSVQAPDDMPFPRETRAAASWAVNFKRKQSR
jgi:hypothetical protein